LSYKKTCISSPSLCCALLLSSRGARGPSIFLRKHREKREKERERLS